MKNLILGLTLLVTTVAFAKPEYGIHDLAFTRRDLHFIITQNRALVGERFLKLSEAEQRDLYEKMKQNPDLFELFPARKFGNLINAMSIASKVTPGISGGAKISDEDLVKKAYFLKRLFQEMGETIPDYKKSLSLIKPSYYKKGTERIGILANQVCDVFGTSAVSKLLTGKSCKDVVNKDILDLINPYRDLDRSNGLIFSSSINLISNIIPDRNFANNRVFIALSKMKTVKRLDPNLDLLENLSRRFPFLSNLEVIRLINVADTNYGASYFAVNAAIDLSPDLASAQMHVMNIRKGYVRLYQLFEEHLHESRAAGTKRVLSYTRQYHYWAGAWLTCELMQRDYPSYVAQYISASSGVAYEALTGGQRALDLYNKDGLSKFFDKHYDTIMTQDNSFDDSEMHILGAELGRKVCE